MNTTSWSTIFFLLFKERNGKKAAHFLYQQPYLPIFKKSFRTKEEPYCIAYPICSYCTTRWHQRSRVYKNHLLLCRSRSHTPPAYILLKLKICTQSSLIFTHFCHFCHLYRKCPRTNRINRQKQNVTHYNSENTLRASTRLI